LRGCSRSVLVEESPSLIFPPSVLLFDLRSAHYDPRKVADMSQVDVVSDSVNDSFQVLVASCVDLSDAAGFTTIVAFVPRGIGA
jgi:hypothetical protein